MSLSFSLCPSCLFVDCSANRILYVSVGWFAWSGFVPVCVNCVNSSGSGSSSQRGTRRILVKRTESAQQGQRVCFVWGETLKERTTTTRTHTHIEREREREADRGPLSNALRELPSADPLQCACFGLFWPAAAAVVVRLFGCFLRPVAPRTELQRELRTPKEWPKMQPPLVKRCLSSAAAAFVDWSSSSSRPRFSFSVHCKEHELTHRACLAKCSPMVCA